MHSLNKTKLYCFVNIVNIDL